MLQLKNEASSLDDFHAHCIFLLESMGLPYCFLAVKKYIFRSLMKYSGRAKERERKREREREREREKERERERERERELDELWNCKGTNHHVEEEGYNVVDIANNLAGTSTSEEVFVREYFHICGNPFPQKFFLRQERVLQNIKNGSRFDEIH